MIPTQTVATGDTRVDDVRGGGVGRRALRAQLSNELGSLEEEVEAPLQVSSARTGYKN